MLWEEIRKAHEVHQRGWRDRAVWALAVYWFGRWSMGLSSTPLRWVTSKIYGFLNIVSQIVTGVYMDRHVQIGEGFHIIHANTIFIQTDCVIGDRVGIMHNVTLGTNMSSDVPVIGNDVFIGTGASVLGKVHVGDGARIAANSLVIMDVPAGAFAVGVPAKVFKRPGFAVSKRADPTTPD